MSNDTRDIFSGLKARKPQYVLGTKNGDIRTSNVTEEKILDAIDDIEDNGCVYLEKCVPVVLVSDAKAYSIDYFKDSSIAVCFMVKTGICCECGGRTLIATWPPISCVTSSAPHRSLI